MARLYDEMDIRKALRAAVHDAGTATALASTINIPVETVLGALSGDRHPTDRLARVLGFEPVTKYTRINPSKAGLP